MPGYLIKTAYFVAEIANDDELVQLAKNDTVKKDTKICVKPGHTWIDARLLPILREVWGLDSDVVPPPIKMPQKSPEEQANSETVVDYRPDFIPPGREVSDRAEQSREPVVPTVSSHIMQAVSEEDLVDDDECSMPGIPIASVHEMLNIKPNDAADKVQVEARSSETYSAELDSIPRSESAEFMALIKNCGKQVDKVENLENVSHAWVLDNGISTQNMPHSELELEARAIGAQRAEEKLRQSSALNPEVQRDFVHGISEVVSVVKEAIDTIANNEENSGEDVQDSLEVDENIPTFVESQSELENAASGVTSEPQQSSDGDSVAALDKLLPKSSLATPSESQTESIDSSSAVDKLLPKSSVDMPSEAEFAENTRSSESDEKDSSDNHPQDAVKDENEDLFGNESGLSGQAWQVAKEPSMMLAFGQEILEPEKHISMVSVNAVEPVNTLENKSGHDNPHESADISERDAIVTDMESNGANDHTGTDESIPSDEDQKSDNVLSNTSAQVDLSVKSEDGSDSGHISCDALKENPEVIAESVETIPENANKNAYSASDDEEDEEDFTRLDYARNLEAVSVDVSKKESGNSDEVKIEETKRVELKNVINPSSKSEPESVLQDTDEPILNSESSQNDDVGVVKSKTGATLEIEVDRLLLESSGKSEDQKPEEDQEARDEDLSSDQTFMKQEPQNSIHPEANSEDDTSERDQGKELFVASGLTIPLLDGISSSDENSKEMQDAVDVLKRETEKDEFADPSNLRRAQSLLQAIEKPKDDAVGSNEDMLDEAPSEVFTVYNRNDVLKGIQSSNSNPSISSVHRSIDEESSRSELRRMLEAEVRAVESEDMPALEISRDLAATSGQGDIRSLFEKEDELHLYPENDSNRINSENQNSLVSKEASQESSPTDPHGKSMTEELPIRNDKVVVHTSAPTMAEATVLTPIKELNKNAVDVNPDAKETVFEIKLQEGESEIARYNSLVLSTHRLWNFEGKGFACYDVENIQWHGLKVKTSLWVFAFFIALVVLDGIYYYISRNELIAGIILVWLLIMLAFVYFYYSYSTTLNIGFGGTNICKKVPRADVEKVKEFLEKVEEAKNNRRLQIGK